MAKRRYKKTAVNQKKTSQKRAFESLKKSDFWIGVLTTIVLLTLAVRLPINQVFKEASKYRVLIVKITPYPTIQTKLAISSPTPTIRKVVSPTVVVPTEAISTEAVPPMSNYVVKENDSYYEATVNVCGDGTFYSYNQELNDSQPLQIGETILIRCDW